MTMLVVQMLASLGVVIALMFGISKLMKKYVGLFSPQKNHKVAIDVLGQKNLTPKRAIHVVKVLNTVYVLGSAENGLTVLGEMDGEEVVRASTEFESTSVPSISNSSQSIFFRLPDLGTLMGSAAAQSKNSAEQSFTPLLQERRQRLAQWVKKFF